MKLSEKILSKIKTAKRNPKHIRDTKKKPNNAGEMLTNAQEDKKTKL